MSELQSLGTFMGSAFQRIDANLEALTAILQNGVQCHCNCCSGSEGGGSGSTSEDPNSSEEQSMSLSLNENGRPVLSWPTDNSISSVYVQVVSKASSSTGCNMSGATYQMSTFTYDNVNRITSVECTYQNDYSSCYYIAAVAVFINSAGEVIDAQLMTSYPAS